MTAIAAGHAGDSDWKRSADRCLAQLDLNAGTLGFVYVTDPFAAKLDTIVDYLRERTGAGDWVGTVGLGVCGSGIEYYEQPAVVALLTDIPRESYRVIGPVDTELSEIDRHQREWISHTRSMFGVVHADPHQPRTPDLVRDLAHELNQGFLVGGLTSAHSGSPQYCNKPTNGGLSGVIFAPDLSVTSGLTQGCSPLTRPHEITGSQGNILITLDDRPALDVLKEDVGELLARDLQQLGGYIFAGLPIPGSDTGDYLVRNLVGLDPERKLVAVGENLTAGESLMFCRRDSDTARADLERMLEDLAARSEQPRGGLYFSCLARGRNMFGGQSAELKLIRQRLGDLPLAGFFANGEISHDRLYGYTGVLTLFS